jgi:hypothetical protein
MLCSLLRAMLLLMPRPPLHPLSSAACQPSACAAPPPALPSRQGKLVDSSAAPSVDDRHLAPIVGVTCGSQPSTTSNKHCHPGKGPIQAGPRPALLWVPIQPLPASEGHLLGVLWQRRQDTYSVRPTKTQLVSIAAVRQTSCSAAGKLRMCNALGSCDVYFEFANVPSLRGPT